MSTTSALPADGEIVSERVFDRPRGVVYGAFADPETLTRWWGPKGFTNTFHEFDLRPGGLWRFVMRGPDGSEYPLTKEFIEVAPPERVVLRQLGGMHPFEMAMTFTEEGRGTRVTWRMRFDPPEEGERVRSFIAAANEENFDRLERALAADADIRLLSAAYAAFNARDIAAALATMSPNVAWPKAFKGGFARGHAEVRAYWTEQWSEIDPHVEPASFHTEGDGRIIVDVHQVVRDLAGGVLGDEHVGHRFTLGNGLIQAMEVCSPP